MSRKARKYAAAAAAKRVALVPLPKPLEPEPDAEALRLAALEEKFKGWIEPVTAEGESK